MDNHLIRACEELAKEENAKKKKKHSLELPKEKKLGYYSGWHKDDKPAKEIKNKGEKQRKLL